MSDPTSLEDIEGVVTSTAAALREIGITTIEALAVTPPREIMEKAKLGFNTLLKIQEAARKLIAADFRTAKEFYERRKAMRRCTTGSSNLDALLGGGIETQALTELIGQYGSGKTQICLTLSVTAQLLPERGGLGGKIAFIDTEGTFMPERVYEIASKMGLDPNEVAKNILVARVYNSSHQCLLMDRLFTFVPENNIKLVVVDSMISHFRGEYFGRENLAERQQTLNQYLHKLLRLTEAYNIAVAVTNQVQANPNPSFKIQEVPAGGNVMAHACTHRIYLYKGSKGVRTAKVIDSPCLPENTAKFIITQKGIENAPEND